MRTTLSALFFCLALCFIGAAPAEQAPTPKLSAHFSPHGDCTASIVRDVAAAKSSIYVQAYVLSSQPVATALADAKARGVDVAVIIDSKGSKMMGSRYTWLVSKNVAVFLDQAHPIAHNKVIIIDGNQVLTGSFNFSEQAEKENAENLLEVNDDAIAQQYIDNWQKHKSHCLPTSTATEETPKATASESTTNTCPCANGRCSVPQAVERRWRR